MVEFNDRTYTRRRMLQTSLGAALAVTGLSACGGGGGAAGGDGSTPSVTVVNTSATGALALGHLLDKLKYYDQFGVSVKTKNVQAGNQVLAGIASGSADMTVLSGLIGLFPALAKGMPAKLVGGTQVVSTSAIFTGNPKIQRIADLKGKTIGVGAVGAELYSVFVALLSREGISKNDVTFRNVGSSADSFKAALARQVDCGYAQVGDEAEAKKHGCRMIATVAHELPLWMNQGAVASTRAIERKRDALVRVLAAYGKLFEYLATPESKASYVAAYVKAGGSPDSAALEWQFVNGHRVYSPTFELPQDKLNFIQQQNVKSGTQDAVLPFDKYTNLSLVKGAKSLIANKPI